MYRYKGGKREIMDGVKLATRERKLKENTKAKKVKTYMKEEEEITGLYRLLTDLRS